MEGEIADLSQVSLTCCIEFFLKQLKARLRLTFLIRLLIVLVKGLDHLLVLSLRLFELLLTFLQLHGEELDLLVPHRNILL